MYCMSLFSSNKAMSTDNTECCLFDRPNDQVEIPVGLFVCCNTDNQGEIPISLFDDE